MAIPALLSSRGIKRCGKEQMPIAGGNKRMVRGG